MLEPKISIQEDIHVDPIGTGIIQEFMIAEQIGNSADAKKWYKKFVITSELRPELIQKEFEENAIEVFKAFYREKFVSQRPIPKA